MFDSSSVRVEKNGHNSILCPNSKKRVFDICAEISTAYI